MSVTLIILVIILILLLFYDIWAVIHWGIQASISWTIWSASIRFPILPFAIGVLCGHFFWRQEAPQEVKCLEVAPSIMDPKLDR